MNWRLVQAILAVTVFLAGLSAFADGSIGGPVYYVAPYGDDSRSKSQAANPSTPWRTLQKAADNVVAGDTVVVMDGVYTSDTTNYLAVLRTSGTAEDPIRFVSQNRWGAVLDGLHANHSLIYMRENVSHIIVEGFEIRNARHFSFWYGNSSGHIVGHIYRGNRIYHHGRGREVNCPNGGTDGSSGIHTRVRARNFLIENNLIHSIGRLPSSECPLENHKYDHAIYLMGQGHVVRNNILFDNNAGWDFSMSVHVEEGATFPTHEWGMVVVNNTFASYNSEYRRFGRATMRGGTGSPRNLLIMNNIFWDDRSGIDMHRVYPNTIIVNNITMSDHMNESFSHGDRDAEILSAGGTVSGNITNRTHPVIKGTDLGMVNPRHYDPAAQPKDFAPRADAQLLIGRGRPAFSHPGLPTVYAPAVDFHGVPRPNSSAPELGALVGGN